MGADHERRLLARARELADLSDARDETLACLGAARHAGLDPEALAGLVGCAAALGATSTATYTAGDGWDATHPDERHFLGHIHAIDDDLEEHLHALTHLGRQANTALDTASEDLDGAHAQLTTARRQLAAAHAMTTSDPCDGCHRAKTAATATAHASVRAAGDLVRECQARAGICDEVIRLTRALAGRVRHALARLRAVPADLGETYESVYRLLRRSGRMPYDGRWLTGASPTR
jgi:hypothetical protein